MGSQSQRGSSTTRGSERNSARYPRTASGVGAEGVPRLTRRMASRIASGTRQVCDSALDRSFAVTSTIGTTRS
jgi:hypothetical protein